MTVNALDGAQTPKDTAMCAYIVEIDVSSTGELWLIVLIVDDLIIVGVL